MADQVTVDIYDENGNLDRSVKVSKDDMEQDERLRAILSNVYVFVRSAALNRSISAYTLDHFLVKAKQDISASRQISDADGDIFDSRPSKLELLNALKDEFSTFYSAAKAKAQEMDDSEEEP